MSNVNKVNWQIVNLKLITLLPKFFLLQSLMSFSSKSYKLFIMTKIDSYIHPQIYQTHNQLLSSPWEGGCAYKVLIQALHFKMIVFIASSCKAFLGETFFS